MAAPILRRRLNPLLLISIVASLSLIAGGTVLFTEKMEQKNDRIEELQDEKYTLNESLNNKTERLSRVKENLNGTKNRTKNLNSRISGLEEKLGNKTQRIRNLQDQIKEQREDLNRSKTIQNLNESLQFICYHESNEGSLLSASESECSKRGIKVGSD